MQCQNSQTVSRTVSGDDDKAVVWVDIPTDGSDNRSLSMKELHRLSRYMYSQYLQYLQMDKLLLLKVFMFRTFPGPSDKDIVVRIGPDPQFPDVKTGLQIWNRYYLIK